VVDNSLLNKEMVFQIFDHLPFGVAYIDEENILRYFNKTMEVEFHYQQERIGENAIDCHKPENRAKVKMILENFKQGKSVKISRIFVTPNSGKKLLTEYLPIYSDAKKYLGSLCVIKDISDVSG
jgi:PAS domain S-box-containing protein